MFWKATGDTSRPDFVPMTPSELAAMQRAHDTYREKAQKLRLPYRTGSQGIVTTAGGAYLPVFIVSLRMLRRTGCTLPVELFLVSEEEREPYLCETLLPSLNARCVVLGDFLGAKTEKITKFQLKIFSTVFSSFEDVLFLDADSFLVRNPQDAFTREPFASTGLITWQDFWASSASKNFYAIQGTPTPPMNAYASSESGQILASKRTHGTALLMTAYYNFYGPEYYYQLLSQGGFGQGDKETFIAGAQAVSAPFYQVKKCVDTIGYYEAGRYHGVAMLQYDPAHDTTGAGAGAGDAATTKKPTPFAVHHNYPKLDPVLLFGDDPVTGAAVGRAGGGYHRLLGDKETTEQRFGRDVEREMWDEIAYVACELGDGFRDWRALPATSERKGTCELVHEYRTAVFS